MWQLAVSDTVQYAILALLVVLGFAAMLLVMTFFQYLSLWMQCSAAGLPVTLFRLFSMKRRGIDPKRVASAMILADRAGLGLTLEQLEDHAVAGGRPDAVVAAAVAGKERGLTLSFDDLAGLDIMGYRVAEVVELAAEHGLRADELTPAFLDQINAPRNAS